MASMGLQEILLIFFSVVLLVVPILIIAAIVYSFVKGYQNSQLKIRDDRIKALEDKLEKLEKEKR